MAYRQIISRGFIPGLLIGGITAILFAPDEGLYTRRKIMRKMRHTQDDLMGKKEDFERKLVNFKKEAMASIDNIGKKFVDKSLEKEL